MNPTGSVTFTLVYQSQTVYTEMVPVNGNGTYTTLTGYALPRTGTVPGSYQWNASYSGDTHNNAASETNSAAEQVSLAIAQHAFLQAQIFGNFLADGSAESCNSTTASLTLSGGYNPTGTLTFSLLLDGLTPAVCTQTVTVNGNGTYTTPTGCIIPTANGDVSWTVTYSGDSNNSSKIFHSNTIEVEL